MRINTQISPIARVFFCFSFDVIKSERLSWIPLNICFRFKNKIFKPQLLLRREFIDFMLLYLNSLYEVNERWCLRCIRVHYANGSELQFFFLQKHLAVLLQRLEAEVIGSNAKIQNRFYTSNLTTNFDEIAATVWSCINNRWIQFTRLISLFTWFSFKKRGKIRQSFFFKLCAVLLNIPLVPVS